MNHTPSERERQVKERVLNDMEYVNTATLSTATINQELQAVFDITKIGEEEARRLFPEVSKHGEIKKKLVESIKNDPACKNVHANTSMGIMELMEKYVFSEEYYRLQLTNRKAIQRYITKRATMLACKDFSLQFPDFVQSIVRYHGAKLEVRNERIHENIGIRMEDISEFAFLDQGDKEYTDAMLTIDNTVQLLQSGKLAAVSTELAQELQKIIFNKPPQNKPPLTPEKVASSLKTVINNFQKENNKAIEGLAEKVEGEIRKNGYDIDPKKPLDERFKQLQFNLKNYYTAQKKLQNICEDILNPALTLHNLVGQTTQYTEHAGVVAPRPIIKDALDIPAIKKLILPQVKQFTDDIHDSYFRELFGHDYETAKEKAKAVIAPELKHDANSSVPSSQYMKNTDEAEAYVKLLTGKEVSFKPGAWFKISKKDKGNYHLYRIRSKSDTNVEFEPSGFQMPIKILAQYLINEKHGEVDGTNIQAEFMYDGKKEPLQTIAALEEKMGLKQADKKGKNSIVPFAKIMRYNLESQQHEVAGEIDSIGHGTIKIKDGRTMSFEEFYLLCQCEKWTIEAPKSSFDSIEGLAPSHTGGVNYVSIKSMLSYYLIDKPKSIIEDVQKNLKINQLQSDVNGYPYGTDQWKSLNKKLMEEEDKAVADKIAELKDAFPKGGQKREGLKKFMAAPPDIRDFKGRVLIKAWMELTLKSFGTLYPFDQPSEFESKRFWLRIFSTSLVPNDPSKYSNPYQEALDNAAKVDGPVDGRVEFKTLVAMLDQGKYTNKAVAGSLSGYAGKVKSFRSEGMDATVKSREEQINATRTTTEIYKVVSETIQNQEWGALHKVFEKLAGKGYKPAEMFHLFLYAFDQIHFIENDQHRSKIPFNDLFLIGKKMSGGFPLPFFAMIANEANYTFFSKMIYGNPYIKDTLGWETGSWVPVNKGTTQEYRVPSTDGAKNLYKFFLARDGNYEILKGIAQDKRKADKLETHYLPEEEDYMKYREILQGLFGNLHGARLNVSPDIDKNSWSISPLLTTDDGFFTKLYSRTPIANGGWANDETKIFFDTLLKEYSSAIKYSSLSQDDKSELSRRVGQLIWDHFWSTYKYKEDTNRAASKTGARIVDPDRDFFAREYGGQLKSLGFDFRTTQAKFDKNEGAEYSYVDNDPNKPIIPYVANGIDNSKVYGNSSSKVDELINFGKK